MVALSQLDEFRLNAQVQTCSVGVPGTSGNNESENREPTWDRFLDDLCPKAVLSACNSSHLNVSGQEETHHKVRGAEEEIPCCSTGTSSGKQTKTRSTSQPQFRSGNSPAKK